MLGFFGSFNLLNERMGDCSTRLWTESATNYGTLLRQVIWDGDSKLEYRHCI